MHAMWPKLSPKQISRPEGGKLIMVHPNNKVVIRPISAFIQLQYTLNDEKSGFSLESLFFVWINFTFTIFFCIFAPKIEFENRKRIYMSKKIFIILLVCSFFFRLQAQEKRALLVGISKYDTALTGYQWNNINGANDVKLLAPILKAKGFKVTTLTDEKATHP